MVIFCNRRDIVFSREWTAAIAPYNSQVYSRGPFFTLAIPFLAFRYVVGHNQGSQFSWFDSSSEMSVDESSAVKPLSWCKWVDHFQQVCLFLFLTQVFLNICLQTLYVANNDRKLPKNTGRRRGGFAAKIWTHQHVHDFLKGYTVRPGFFLHLYLKWIYLCMLNAVFHFHLSAVLYE